ncbi:hypothetical protein FRB99_003478 [Tulasnella sp. 403]|nr:hypothetical protein FRB99_003478 [Tulasnella sp. 403]
MDSQDAVASRKFTGWELYRDVMKSPRRIVAPMVDQSELAWRILSRRYGAEVRLSILQYHPTDVMIIVAMKLVYTPMINARVFADVKQKATYRQAAFNTIHGEEGGPRDRPLFVQLAGNDPDLLLQSAKLLEDHCDAIDINFGCPQDIARRGKYGAYLCDDWDLIYKLINTLHVNLSIPVTAKFRVFSDVDKTVKYAQMMERAGAQILTCHGRTREQRGHNSGLADWSQISAVKKAVSVPVFANGNVLYPDDVERCLAFTGADAYMSAEPQLHNPAIFFTPALSGSAERDQSPPACPSSPSVSSSSAVDSISQETARHPVPHPPCADLALEYLSVVSSLKTPTASSAIKAHLFRLLHHALSRETDLRERLAKVKDKDGGSVPEWEAICTEMKRRMDRDAQEAGWDPLSPSACDFPQDPATGLKTIPHWLAQPKVRRPPPPSSNGSSKASKKASKNKDAVNCAAVLAPGVDAAPSSSTAQIDQVVPTVTLPSDPHRNIALAIDDTIDATFLHG